MIAVIFEVWPADGRKQAYLDIAAELKPELERIDGFLSIERFQSLADETKLLSLSFWRDEAAVAAWIKPRSADPSGNKSMGAVTAVGTKSCRLLRTNRRTIRGNVCCTSCGNCDKT